MVGKQNHLGGLATVTTGSQGTPRTRGRFVRIDIRPNTIFSARDGRYGPGGARGANTAENSLLTYTKLPKVTRGGHPRLRVTSGLVVSAQVQVGKDTVRLMIPGSIAQKILINGHDRVI